MDPRVAIDRLLDRYPPRGPLPSPTFGGLLEALPEADQAELLELAFGLGGRRLVASPHFRTALDDPILGDLLAGFLWLTQTCRLDDTPWQGWIQQAFLCGFATAVASLPRSWQMRELAMVVAGVAEEWQLRHASRDQGRARTAPGAEGDGPDARRGWLVFRGLRHSQFALPSMGGRGRIEPPALAEMADALVSVHVDIERLDAGTMPPWRDPQTGAAPPVEPPTLAEQGRFLLLIIKAVGAD